ncbi:hypothetical protein MRX96_037842 [Rhipicephalus microplus]
MARGKRRTSREFREPKVPEKGSVSNGVAQQDEIWNECTPLFEPHRPTTLFWLKEKGHTKKYRSVDKGPPVLPIRRSPLRGDGCFRGRTGVTISQRPRTRKREAERPR